MIGAVIVAGGSGSRMKASVKKQYLVLDGRPIVAHTLMAFDSCAALDRIVLVVPAADLDYCRTEIVGPLTPGSRYPCRRRWTAAADLGHKRGWLPWGRPTASS